MPSLTISFLGPRSINALEPSGVPSELMVTRIPSLMPSPRSRAHHRVGQTTTREASGTQLHRAQFQAERAVPYAGEGQSTDDRTRLGRHSGMTSLHKTRLVDHGASSSPRPDSSRAFRDETLRSERCLRHAHGLWCLRRL